MSHALASHPRVLALVAVLVGVVWVLAGLVWPDGGSDPGGDGAAAAVDPGPAPPEPRPDVTATSPAEDPTVEAAAAPIGVVIPDGVNDVAGGGVQSESDFPTVDYDALGGVPGPATTGVRDGPPLRTVDRVVVTEDGAVVERVRTSRPIRIRADDVTLRDVEVVYAGDAFAIHVEDGYEGLTVEHSTIELRVSGDGRVPGAGVYGGSGTAVRHTEIRGVSDGIKAASGSVYEGNWIHLERAPGSDKHLDAIQNAADDLVIRGNLLEVRPEQGGNAAYIATTFSDEPRSGILIEGNVLAGGNYTLFLAPDDQCLDDVRVVGNVFVDGSRYGHISDRGCPMDVAGNVRTSR